jgi:hypothetical protein
MTVLMFALLAVLLVGAPGNSAHASCNTVPDPPPAFFGARGSIDRPFVSPDPDEKLELRPTSTRETASVRGIASTDLLITIIFKPPAGESRTFYIAGNDHCEPFEEHACFLERLFCPPPKTCFTGTDVGLEATTGGAMSFHFPETRFAGPVTIAVSLPNQEGRNEPPLELRKRSCSAVLSEAESKRESNLIVCIDDFRQAVDDPPGDPTFAQLVALPQSYDYRTVCTYDDGSAPSCYGTATDVLYTTDSDGDVLMPVRWGNILQAKSASEDFYQRTLLASTAVEAVLGQGNRIYIPSPAFLQTTNLQGGGFSPSPVFVPEELSGRRNEQTVRGTADKGKSTLTFFRRKLWDHACDGGPNQGQACEPASASSDCPSAQCAPSSAAYFACSAGSGLPCTRTAQCPQGACQRVSDKGSVCFGFDGKPTGASCKQDSDCGANAECGPGLFEFRNRTVNGLGTLMRIATNVRGVCAGGPQSGNVCTQSSACGPVDCVTYRAEALAYTTPVPTTTP